MSEPQIMGYTEKYVDGLKKQLTALQSELASAEECIEDLRSVEFNIGKWLSAALEDPNVCDEMKADIVAWFTSKETKHEG